MDSSTFEAIHKYGAILSVVGIGIAVLAHVMGGPGILTVMFGLLGPLCGFYFIGGYLTSTTAYHPFGEELMRGVAWHFASLTLWSGIILMDGLSATPGTVAGLPAVTALSLVLVMASIRYVTARDLKAQTDGGQLLVTVVGTFAMGVFALFLVLSGEAGWWLFALYLSSIPLGIFLRRKMKHRYPAAFGVT